MNKFLYICSFLCITTCQLAYAQQYEYTGHNTPTYININGEQYVRIPQSQTIKQTYSSPSNSFQMTQSSSNSKKNSSFSPNTTTKLKLKPYIGIDFGYDKLNREKLNKNSTELSELTPCQFTNKNLTLSGIIGLKLTPNFSLEAFYQDSIDKNKKKGTTTLKNNYSDITLNFHTNNELSFKSYGIDTIYNTTIFNQNTQLLLALGIGNYDIDAKYQITPTTGEGIFAYSSSNQSIGYRFGIGGQYNFTPHLGLNTMLRYIKLTDDKIIDDMIELSMGLRYYF